MGHFTHLVPINKPLPTAKHTPTILNVTLFWSSPRPSPCEDEAADADADIVALALADMTDQMVGRTASAAEICGAIVARIVSQAFRCRSRLGMENSVVVLSCPVVGDRVVTSRCAIVAIQPGV